MADPLITVVDRVGEVGKLLRDLAKVRVMVGVPSDDEPHPGTGHDARTGEDVGNAFLLYVHENGSPVNNLPARPSLGPGVRDSKDRWGNYMKQAATAALEGRRDAVERALNAAGLAAVAAVKAKITAGIPPPLTEGTVRARQRRHPGRKATSAGGTTPLVDTAQLLNSITYIVRKK